MNKQNKQYGYGCGKAVGHGNLPEGSRTLGQAVTVGYGGGAGYGGSGKNGGGVGSEFYGYGHGCSHATGNLGMCGVGCGDSDGWGLGETPETYAGTFWKEEV